MINTRSTLTGAATKAAQAIESGATISEAARASGVSRGTIYAWIKKGLTFPRHILEAKAATELAKKTETNILARLAFSTIAEILSNHELPASVRARVALAVLEQGNIEESKWGVPDPVLENDAELPKPAVQALTEEARKLYTLNKNLTAADAQLAENTRKRTVNTKEKILYTGGNAEAANAVKTAVA